MSALQHRLRARRVPRIFSTRCWANLGDEDFDGLDESDIVTCAQSLASKRRRAEQRLEALRLREELGDFDFDFEDDL